LRPALALRLLRQALELELDRERAVLLARATDVAASHGTETPAARVVFPAHVLLEGLLLEEGIAVASEDSPFVGHWPDHRHVALLEQVAAEAIAESDQPVVLRPVLEACLRARRRIGLAVPLEPEIEVPDLPVERHLGHVVRRVRAVRRRARQAHVLGLEVAR